MLELGRDAVGGRPPLLTARNEFVAFSRRCSVPATFNPLETLVAFVVRKAERGMTISLSLLASIPSL